VRNNGERLGESSLAKTETTVTPLYETDLGAMYIGRAEEVLLHNPLTRAKSNIQLIFTSPPFPLNRKKKYGNKQGKEYIDWLAGLASLFRSYLRENGSIVMEMGNAWEPGKPVMSTLAMKALLAFQEEGKFFLCQELISYNPARLPSPAQWVNVERIRLKDSFTRLWWMSPSDRPKADNRRVLSEYSESMKKLLKSGKYNHGRRPSEHNIGEKSFLKNNGGAIRGNVLKVVEEESIPNSVLEFANTRASDPYQNYCRTKALAPHPARMPLELPLFFIKFLTEEADLVLDSFAGSNTTGEAAESLHRRWISIEASPEYAESSRGRFQQLTL
jgi:site-specific DNA-methyltransferase (cytosine-N4-specific)